MLHTRGGAIFDVRVTPHGLAQITPPGHENISFILKVSEHHLSFPMDSLATRWIKLNEFINEGACEVVVNGQTRDLTEVESRQYAVLYDNVQHQFSIRNVLGQICMLVFYFIVY